ncbi:hypothetical protein C8R44DRAFT_50207 [Mycena epipterygia]|nr:hypothetical protein C8R44DRAFT_50207 [Mycena epipterygia]
MPVGARLRALTRPETSTPVSFNPAAPTASFSNSSVGRSLTFSSSTASTVISNPTTSTIALTQTISPSSTQTPHSTSHSAGPSASAITLRSSRQAKPKVGAIVGGALAILAVIFALFLWRYLVMQRRKRKTLPSPAGRGVLDLVTDMAPLPKLATPTTLTIDVKKLTKPHTTEPEQHTPASASELRVQKQLEAIQHMQDAKSGPEPLSSAHMETPADLESARRQNELLRQRIQELERLHQQTNSTQLTDRPPPGYSA